MALGRLARGAAAAGGARLHGQGEPGGSHRRQVSRLLRLRARRPGALRRKTAAYTNDIAARMHLGASKGASANLRKQMRRGSPASVGSVNPWIQEPGMRAKAGRRIMNPSRDCKSPICYGLTLLLDIRETFDTLTPFG